VPRDEASAFGVIQRNPHSSMIDAFLEKPADPPGLADSPDEVLASMGNYIFSTEVLVDVLNADAEDKQSGRDLGGDIIPALVSSGQAHVYDFTTNVVPGETPRDRHYWRDVGTLDSYYEANMDLVAPHPVFNLYNSDWPVFTSFRTLPPAKVVAHGEYGSGDIANSVLSAGCIVTGATVHDSVLSPNVRIEPGARVEGSILFDDVHVGANATIRNAIVDKHVVIPRNREIGTNPDRDAEEFVISPSGIIAIGKGHKVKYA